MSWGINILYKNTHCKSIWWICRLFWFSIFLRFFNLWFICVTPIQYHVFIIISIKNLKCWSIVVIWIKVIFIFLLISWRQFKDWFWAVFSIIKGQDLALIIKKLLTSFLLCLKEFLNINQSTMADLEVWSIFSFVQIQEWALISVCLCCIINISPVTGQIGWNQLLSGVVIFKSLQYRRA